MKFIKKFEKFMEGATEVAPVKPKEKEKERVAPTKPGGIPSRDPRPDQAPDTVRAGIDDTNKDKKKASAEEVAERFINLMAEEGEDVKKYTEFK